VKATVYYRKDPSWLATSPLAPPELGGPDSLVEVHRFEIPKNKRPGWRWRRGELRCPRPESVLEYVWLEMQNIDGLTDLSLAVRSMMVGDVVSVKNRAWEVEAVGWKQVSCSWLKDPTVAPPHKVFALVSDHEESQE
jgi:hypothetical protein